MMRVRCIRLRAFTAQGEFGRTVNFEDGLTVLRGPNSIGKSTFLMSFLYGLGLEGMLTAKHQVPLPHAVTEYLEEDSQGGGGSQIPVERSEVLVEVENRNGDALTVRRSIKGSEDAHLIQTWAGRVADRTERGASTDFFVRMSGAAQREAGFHHRLARFLGWDLPKVPTFDAQSVPLYLELLFPLLFVEQKRGWLGLNARMPTHLRIREPQTRAVEFLLAMDEEHARIELTELQAQITRLTELWNQATAAVKAIANGVHGEPRGIPASASDAWPEEAASIVVPEGLAWMDIVGRLQLRQARLQQLLDAPVPSAGTATAQSSEELATHERRLAELNALATRLEEESELAEVERDAAEHRAEALRRDRQRNKDIERLRKLGSVTNLAVASDRCPTCNQPVSGHLMAQERMKPMSLEENLSFIEDMLATVEASGRATAQRLDLTQRRLRAVAEERREVRAAIRRLRRGLIQDERVPSLSVIEERVRLEQEIEKLKSVSNRYADAARALKSVHDDLSKAKSRLPKLADRAPSVADRKKLGTLRDSFIEQIEEYGLRSLPGARISINPSSFRPEAEGMPDLEFELSGSDLIRAIWAYYVALLETARHHPTNHPGFLIVDEPKQQGTDVVAISRMLRRAATAKEARQQVIVSSSEGEVELASALAGVPFVEVSFDKWLLRRVEPSQSGENE